MYQLTVPHDQQPGSDLEQHFSRSSSKPSSNDGDAPSAEGDQPSLERLRSHDWGLLFRPLQQVLVA